VTAPGEAIVRQTEAFRAWRWSDCPTWEESITRLDSILRQCESDAERAYVMRVAANSPVKDTPGPDADAEVKALALKTLARLPAHDGKVKPAAREVLKDHEDQSIGLFNRVCKRTYLERQNAEKPCVAGLSRIAENLET
jgi:hypothetical protein